MERPWDIIDEIQGAVGKIRSKGGARKGSEGYYGEYYRDAIRGPAKVLFSPDGQSPDEVVDSLRETGTLGRDADVDTLWDKLRAANESRRAFARREGPEAQRDRFTKALAKRSTARCKRLVPVNSLAVGDELYFDRERMEVSDLDPDTSEVTLRDGKRFGRQQIPDGVILPVDEPCKKREPKPLKPPRITRAAVKRLGGLIAARRERLARRKPSRARPTPKRAPRRQKPKATKPARTTARARPALLAVRRGRFYRLFRAVGSKLVKIGTYSRLGLLRWARKNKIRVK